MSQTSYVALDATCFEQGFLDYPRVLPDEAIDYAWEQAQRTRLWTVARPLEDYLAAPLVEGGLQLEGFDGASLVLGHCLARCAEASWSGPPVEATSGPWWLEALNRDGRYRFALSQEQDGRWILAWSTSG